jgi:UMF1 family MFS transporter
MYDWANSAFSTTVVTVFLGPYLTAISKAATATGGLFTWAACPSGLTRFSPTLFRPRWQVTFLPVAPLADYRPAQAVDDVFAVLAQPTMLHVFHWPQRLCWAPLFVPMSPFGASIVFNSYLPSMPARTSDHAGLRFCHGYLGAPLPLINPVLSFATSRAPPAPWCPLGIPRPACGGWAFGHHLRSLRARHAVRALPARTISPSASGSFRARWVSTGSSRC